MGVLARNTNGTNELEDSMTARSGAYCGPVGATDTTVKGTPMECMDRGAERARWASPASAARTARRGLLKKAKDLGLTIKRGLPDADVQALIDQAQVPVADQDREGQYPTQAEYEAPTYPEWPAEQQSGTPDACSITLNHAPHGACPGVGPLAQPVAAVDPAAPAPARVDETPIAPAPAAAVPAGPRSPERVLQAVTDAYTELSAADRADGHTMPYVRLVDLRRHLHDYSRQEIDDALLTLIDAPRSRVEPEPFAHRRLEPGVREAAIMIGGEYRDQIAIDVTQDCLPTRPETGSVSRY